MYATNDPVEAARKRAEQEAMLAVMQRRAGAPRDVTRGPEGTSPAAGSLRSMGGVARQAAEFAPGIGTAMGAMDAAQAFRGGDAVGGAIGLASMLPLGRVGAKMGKTLRQMDQGEIASLMNALGKEANYSGAPKSEMLETLRDQWDVDVDSPEALVELQRALIGRR